MRARLVACNVDCFVDVNVVTSHHITSHHVTSISCCRPSLRSFSLYLSLSPPVIVGQSRPVCAAAGDVREAHASSAGRHAIRRSGVPPGGEQEHLVHRLHCLHVHHHYGRRGSRPARLFSRGEDCSPTIPSGDLSSLRTKPRYSTTRCSPNCLATHLLIREDGGVARA